MKYSILSTLLLIIVLGIGACSKSPEINDNTMLDGDKIFDPSLYDSAKYLVSVAIENPTTAQINTPVVIAAHGYSATTFEWDDFRTFADKNGGIPFC